MCVRARAHTCAQAARTCWMAHDLLHCDVTDAADRERGVGLAPWDLKGSSTLLGCVLGRNRAGASA